MPDLFILPSGAPMRREGDRWVIGYGVPLALTEEEARHLLFAVREH